MLDSDESVTPYEYMLGLCGLIALIAIMLLFLGTVYLRDFFVDGYKEMQRL